MEGLHKKLPQYGFYVVTDMKENVLGKTNPILQSKALILSKQNCKKENCPNLDFARF